MNHHQGGNARIQFLLKEEKGIVTLIPLLQGKDMVPQRGSKVAQHVETRMTLTHPHQGGEMQRGNQMKGEGLIKKKRGALEANVTTK